MAKLGRPKTPGDLAKAMLEVRQLRAKVAKAEAKASRRDSQPSEIKIESPTSSNGPAPDED